MDPFNELGFELHRAVVLDDFVLDEVEGSVLPWVRCAWALEPSFHPLDAPIPMLVVRHMVATDFPFISGRTDWVERYLRKFAPALPAGVRSIIVYQFDEAA